MILLDKLFRAALALMALGALLILLPVLFCQPQGLPLQVFRFGFNLLLVSAAGLIAVMVLDGFALLQRTVAQLDLYRRPS